MERAIYSQNNVNIFRSQTTGMHLRLRIWSPTELNRTPAAVRVMYGRADRNPVLLIRKPSTWFMNFGTPVIRKKTPQSVLNCSTSSAKNGGDVNIFRNGGHS